MFNITGVNQKVVSTYKPKECSPIHLPGTVPHRRPSTFRQGFDDTGAVKPASKTLLSHLVTGEFSSTADSLRTSHVRVEPPSRPPLDPL
eukprot:976544-Prorocentrum_minimum.AAC.1